MITHGSLAAQIELEAARTTAIAPLLPFPADLLLGFGHIVADDDAEWADGLDAIAADAA